VGLTSQARSLGRYSEARATLSPAPNQLRALPRARPRESALSNAVAPPSRAQAMAPSPGDGLLSLRVHVMATQPPGQVASAVLRRPRAPRRLGPLAIQTLYRPSGVHLLDSAAAAVGERLEKTKNRIWFHQMRLTPYTELLCIKLYSGALAPRTHNRKPNICPKITRKNIAVKIHISQRTFLPWLLKRPEGRRD